MSLNYGLKDVLALNRFLSQGNHTLANIRYARVVVRKVHETLEILPSFFAKPKTVPLFS